MRFTLRFFALLDALSLIFLGMQVWHIATHFQEVSVRTSEKVQAILMFPMFILVIVGAIGMFLLKRFAVILYYIQFPFRLYLWIFTVGFITLLPAAFNDYDDKWFDVLLKACYVAEFIRLYLTIWIHRKHLHNNA